MNLKFPSVLWSISLWFDEIIMLIVCLSLDFFEIIFPPLMVPLIGDILDFTGVVFCVTIFGWIGFPSLLELIPGLDVLPIFTATWLMWYVIQRRDAKTRMERQLERWR